MKWLALACALGSACTIAKTKPAFGPDDGPGRVDCRAAHCPSDEDIIWAEVLFRRHFPDADMRPVRVIIREADEDGYMIDSWGRKVRGAWNHNWIECPSSIWTRCWPHERIHVKHDRDKTPTGHPGGVWPTPGEQDHENQMKDELTERVLSATETK